MSKDRRCTDINCVTVILLIVITVGKDVTVLRVRVYSLVNMLLSRIFNNFYVYTILFAQLPMFSFIIEKKSWGQRKVKIRNGEIRGLTVSFPTAPYLRYIEAFLGVDYGSLKRNIIFTFHPASDAIPNRKEDYIACTTFKGVCPQPFNGVSQFYDKIASRMVREYIRIAKHSGSQVDDCLSLNVYSLVPGNHLKNL